MHWSLCTTKLNDMHDMLLALYLHCCACSHRADWVSCPSRVKLESTVSLNSMPAVTFCFEVVMCQRSRKLVELISL
jgi:hypothetical protein